MPFVLGMSLMRLEAGSHITVHLLPVPTTRDDNGNTTTSTSSTFTQPILDVSDLSSTFLSIAESLPKDVVNGELGIPSYLPKNSPTSIQPIIRGVHKPRGIFRQIQLTDNIGLVKSKLDLDPSNPSRNELFIEIGSDVIYARAVYTEVEEGIRSEDRLKEFCLSLPAILDGEEADRIAARIIDPVREMLNASPTAAGSELKNIIIIGDNEPIRTRLSGRITNTFVGANTVLVPSDYAHYAAQYALRQYQNRPDPKDHYIMQVVPFRIGIVKADGFVLTALREHLTIPHENAVIVTTSTNNQTTATIQIVVGVSPVSKDNIIIAELVLPDLKPRPKGETIIEVTFSALDDLDKVTIGILAEELAEEGTTGATASTTIDLQEMLANDVSYDDIEDMTERGTSSSDRLSAQAAEDKWAGERVQGELPP